MKRERKAGVYIWSCGIVGLWWLRNGQYKRFVLCDQVVKNEIMTRRVCIAVEYPAWP
jgi:hypothetical protein